MATETKAAGFIVELRDDGQHRVWTEKATRTGTTYRSTIKPQSQNWKRAVRAALAQQPAPEAQGRLL